MAERAHDGLPWSKAKARTCVAEIIERGVENRYVNPLIREGKKELRPLYGGVRFEIYE